ncbi:MAG: HrcA family transcriptional regulator, partial [Synechococcaceae bacterium WB6_3B_236]|nr:HrcA family transcriptional regulator [Synechococcaceae bacterium WB6_3B_236]
MIPLPQRQQQVLQATVRHYVDTVEPVGSQVLVRRFGLDASPATVRSAMGALEQRGYLTQPHTSAGRVPSPKGYRHYVDCLLPAELAELSLQWSAFEDLLQHLARRLADFTGLLSLITRPQRPQPRLKALRLVASGDRLLVFLVESSAVTCSLNLRRPEGSADQLQFLERWLTEQLEEGAAGLTSGIPWSALPPHLQSTGAPLRRALDSHNKGRNRQAEGALTQGLSGLLAQPEFSQTASLRPLLQLVEQRP